MRDAPERQSLSAHPAAEPQSLSAQPQRFRSNVEVADIGLNFESLESAELPAHWSQIPISTSRFSGIIRIRGINPYILVSAARANAVRPGWRKALPVLLRINGKPAQPWRVNMMPVGNGSFYLYLHGDIRKASGSTVGDRVGVEIAFDASYRNGPQHPMPRCFREALGKNPQAMKNWTVLIPSRKKEILRYFSKLNSDEARARNLAKALHVLSGESGRFMARAWKGGS